MKKENVIVKKSTFEHLAPSGRGWHAVPGEGVLNKEHLIGTPSSPLWGTSPARGEVNGGFTLIELLVVVLIIGILAAVAVPQYQKAVLKSRFATIKDLTRSIANAEEIYYLANGSYTIDIEELDINMPTPTTSSVTTTNGTYFYPWGYCMLEVRAEQDVIYCILSNEKNPINSSLSNRIIAYWIAFEHSSQHRGKRACYSFGEDLNSAQDKICQAETGKENADVSDTLLRQWVY